MPKKKSDPFGVSGVVNAPQPIHMINNQWGLVEVSTLYLWLRMSENGKRTQFKIDGKELYRWSENPNHILLMGRLSFRMTKIEDRKVVVIEPRDSNDDFQFEVQVGLIGLKEALFYYFN